MTLHVKDGSVWRTPYEIQVKDGGVWRAVQEVWVKEAGVWRQSYTAAITLTNVNASNISVDYEDTPSSAVVQGISTATTTPTDDGSVSYTWTKVSGDTISNSGSGNKRTFSANLSDGQQVDAVYRCTASNANGSVQDDFTIHLSYLDIGS